jgi:hypothetical protein
MLTEPKLDSLINGRREQGAANYRETQPITDLLAYQQQLLHALAQGGLWMGSRLPLSFQPSPYRVRVKESNFFAASALECMQLPLLLGEGIEVETLCPSTGSTIQLIITDQGVARQSPRDSVMSLAVTGQTSAEPPMSLADLLNLARQQTRFFSSAEAAALWLVAYPDVQILQLDQAWRLATSLAVRRHESDQIAAIPVID